MRCSSLDLASLRQRIVGIDIEEAVLKSFAVADLGESTADGHLTVDDNADTVAKLFDKAEYVSGHYDGLALSFEIVFSFISFYFPISSHNSYKHSLTLLIVFMPK